MSLNKQPYFTYEDLGDQYSCFRLLEIMPGRDSEPISCVLRRARLGDRPTYSAASYRWGEVGHCMSITINECSFRIQFNLGLFLRRLRKHDCSRLLWIDAICVNQLDPSERNHQVRLMKRIYSGATSVFVWLGVGAHMGQRAFDFLSATALNLPAQQLKEHYNDIFGSEDSVHLWSALASLCRQSYWTRTWIVQEIILARDITFFCGNCHVSWDAFKYACAGPGMLNDFGILTSNRMSAVHDFKLDISKSVFAQLSQQRALEQTRNLEQLLEAYGKSQCHDIRDRVYGLLGLAADYNDGGLNLEVDYNCDAEVLLFRVMNFCRPANPVRFALYLERVLECRWDSWRESKQILSDYVSTSLTSYHVPPGVPESIEASIYLVGILAEDLTAVMNDAKMSLFRLQTPFQRPSVKLRIKQLGFHREDRLALPRPQTCFVCPEAQMGDSVFQFAESDIAFVFRAMSDLSGERFVGRAIIGNWGGQMAAEAWLERATIAMQICPEMDDDVIGGINGITEDAYLAEACIHISPSILQVMMQKSKEQGGFFWNSQRTTSATRPGPLGKRRSTWKGMMDVEYSEIL